METLLKQAQKEQVMLAKLKAEKEEADKMMDAIGGEQDAPAAPAPEVEDPQTPPAADAETKPEPKPEPKNDNQEVARLQEEVNRLRAQLDDENNQTHRSQALLFKSQRDTAREENRSLKEQLKAAQAAPQPAAAAVPEEPDAEYLTLVEELGEKAAKIVWKNQQKGKLSADEIGRIVEEKTRPVLETVGNIGKNQAVTEQERFFNNLTKAVPDWQDLNGGSGKPQDPKFTQFLDTPVPLQDYSYNDLLLHYHTQGNVGKVADIFSTFKEMNKPAAVVPKPNELEKHLEPTKTNRGTDIPTPDTKPTYTRKEIEEFDRKKRQGTLYGMTPEAIQTKSKLYQDAIFEGRVK